MTGRSRIGAGHVGSAGRVIRSRGVVALLAVLLAAVTACTGSSEADDEKGDGSAGATPVEIAITPEDGASNVATSDELRVTAAGGTLTRVTVTDGQGRAVPGRMSGDRARWTPSEHLSNAARYAVQAVGENPDGERRTRTASFRTVAAAQTFGSTWNIADEAKVGVGMILSVTFDTPIEHTRAVREAIEVTAEPQVEVRGHWFGQQRLDFRPAEYWQPGTEVTVRFRLRGVEGAEGVYGTLREDSHFTVGRSQITTVDARATTMRVVRDGEVLRTIPVTTGAPGYETWNGRMVISEKHVETRMNGDTVGYSGEYDIADVPHAMRLSTSGTFIHGNYWAGESTFGSENASHGCIGLRDVQGAYDSATPGAWFYEHSMIGDVVEVINSNDAVISPDNGLNGWNMPWNQWGAGQ